MFKYLLVGYKFLFAVLGLSAIVTEIVVLMERGVFVPANFFSFFTIESNLLAAVMLIVGAVALMRGRQTYYVGLLRGAAALYMAITGIVFSLLLSGLDPGVLTAVPWDNTVLHYIMPVAVVIDWLLDPPATRLSLKQALLWLLFPIAFVAYTLLRGLFVDWYPYPFLNPATQGYEGIAVVSIGIAILAIILTWLLTLLARRGVRTETAAAS